ncbi:MAG TPA: hypothetical protein VG276_04235, partial [Actinomycetes bacterium]|nr:hypothetical protein [Actinomycetes bacterium]
MLAIAAFVVLGGLALSIAVTDGWRGTAAHLGRVGAGAQELTVESEVNDLVALRVPAELPRQLVQPRPLPLMAGGGLLGFALAAG